MPKRALDDLVYSVIKSTDGEAEQLMGLIGEVRQTVAGVCGTAPGYYPKSLAEDVLAKAAEIEATLQSSLTPAERQAQQAELNAALDTFKASLTPAAIIMPSPSTTSDAHYYTLCTPLRGSRYATSTGAASEVAGVPSTSTAAYWRFVERTDGTLDIVNGADGTYLSPASANNTVLYTQTAQPAKGWELKPADEVGYLIVTSTLNSCQLNQTNMSSTALAGGFKIYNWGGGTNTTDTGCKYRIEEVDASEIESAPSSALLPELDGRGISVSSTPANDIAVGQWYVMYDRGGNRGYLFENVATHTLLNTSTKPGSKIEENGRFLVRLEAAHGEQYYLQTGFGNYFGRIQQ